MSSEPIFFETHPDNYRHLKLEIDGPVAWLKLDIQEDGLRPGYVLKLNSYDLSVDIELADAVNRLRFEHPQVGAVVVTSGRDDCFSAGANIFMLGASTHGFKVNFCKYTNETRIGIEDSSENNDQTYIAAVNGVCSGGGYELALACDEIYLVDDRRSAVSLPEVPFLGVLPGTGGLTRLVDKRKIRRDHADFFCTIAEGLKGKRAKKWGFVDDVFPTSRWQEAIAERARAAAGDGHPERKGVELEPLEPEITDEGITYKHVELTFGSVARTAHLEIQAPTELPELPNDGSPLPSSWYPLRMTRELDDALIRLRFNHPEIGLVLVSTRGDAAKVLELDHQLTDNMDNWYVRTVVHHMKRVFKRFDVSSKSFFALIDEDSCFAGTLLELALGADRSFILDVDDVQVQLSPMNDGPLPMGNGLTRLQSRFLNDSEKGMELAAVREPFAAADAEEAGLVTLAVDDLDWEDEIRVATEERASLSPDALTGMEASLRFGGPETLETKIFGRLSAWQNWIFQRPNAVGERGALSLYGEPESPVFNWERT